MPNNFRDIDTCMIIYFFFLDEFFKWIKKLEPEFTIFDEDGYTPEGKNAEDWLGFSANMLTLEPDICVFLDEDKNSLCFEFTVSYYTVPKSFNEIIENSFEPYVRKLIEVEKLKRGLKLNANKK